jgi:hypothetical protein
MTIRRRAGLYFRFRSPEQLECRDMLSGHAITAGFSHFSAAAAQSAYYQSVAASLISQITAHNRVFAALGSSSSSEYGTVLTASLIDPNSSAAGTVTYKTGTDDGVSETELKVSITGAAVSSPIDVVIGTTTVGQITTDSTGAATAVFSTNPTGTEKSFTTVPTGVAASTSVTIGSLSGSLAAPINTEGGCESSQHTTLIAALTDMNSSAMGTATYKTVTRQGVTTTKLTLSVTGAAVSSKIDVVVGTTTVGQVMTDTTGAGTLVVTTGLPTVTAGTTTVTVGSLSGTFATSSSASGSVFRHWRHR